MRYSRKLVTLLGGLALVAGCAGYGEYAEVGVGPYYGRRYVELYDYSPDYYGDWRYSYRNWSPVVIYESNGRYYSNRQRYSRPVTVYRNRSGYFLPPRDRDWSQRERRFKPNRMPNRSDYDRALRRGNGRGARPRP